MNLGLGKVRIYNTILYFCGKKYQYCKCVLRPLIGEQPLAIKKRSYVCIISRDTVINVIVL